MYPGLILLLYLEKKDFWLFYGVSGSFCDTLHTCGFGKLKTDENIEEKRGGKKKQRRECPYITHSWLYAMAQNTQGK